MLNPVLIAALWKAIKKPFLHLCQKTQGLLWVSLTRLKSFDIFFVYLFNDFNGTEVQSHS